MNRGYIGAYGGWNDDVCWFKGEASGPCMKAAVRRVEKIDGRGRQVILAACSRHAQALGELAKEQARIDQMIVPAGVAQEEDII